MIPVPQSWVLKNYIPTLSESIEPMQISTLDIVLITHRVHIIAIHERLRYKHLGFFQVRSPFQGIVRHIKIIRTGGISDPYV